MNESLKMKVLYSNWHALNRKVRLEMQKQKELHLGASIFQILKVLGIHQNDYYSALRGSRSLTSQEIISLANFLGMCPNQIVKQETRPETSVSLFKEATNGIPVTKLAKELGKSEKRLRAILSDRAAASAEESLEFLAYMARAV